MSPSDMTPEDREHYAREILNNPLFIELLSKLESDAINRAVSAPLTDNMAQQAALAEVRAARTFRQHCLALASNKPPVKVAPA